MSGAVRVVLSSGEFFFVDAELAKVAGHIHEGERKEGRYVYVGSRLVHPDQVCSLEHVKDVSTVEIPEVLED